MNPAGVFKRVQTTAVNALTALAIGNSDGLLPAAEAAVATRWETEEGARGPVRAGSCAQSSAPRRFSVRQCVSRVMVLTWGVLAMLGDG